MALEERVVLFGLSANPPTGELGHRGLVQWALAQTDIPGFGRPSQVWILPVYRHPFDSKSKLAPYAHRVEMCRLAFESLPVRILETEKELASTLERWGTIDVVERLEAQHPSHRFALLLGGDTALDLVGGRWRRGLELLSKVTVIAVPRPGGPMLPADSRFVLAQGVSLGSVSSTAARELQGEALRKLVGSKVAAYIEAHSLYAFGARD